MIGGETPAGHSMEAGGPDCRQEDSYEAVAVRCLWKNTQGSEEGNWVAERQGRRDVSLHVLLSLWNFKACDYITWSKNHFKEWMKGGFPGGTVVKNPPANAGDTGSSPGPGRSHMLRSN